MDRKKDMSATKCYSLIACVVFLGLCATAGIAAQNPGDPDTQPRDNRQPELNCPDNGAAGREFRHCEMREMTIADSGQRIVVDELRNGGVSVRGWSREQIWVRAQIQTQAESEQAANALARNVIIETSGNHIRPEGPVRDGDRSWSVAFEIFVPHRSDLSVAARNGGIHVSDVHGEIEFETLNGGVSLERLGGDVSGHTRNGGVSIHLAGDRWEGERLDVETRNGGVKLEIPENYSAKVETETVNGPINVDFPVTMEGGIGRRLSFQLGSGGGLVRAVTTNGGVLIRRKPRNRPAVF